MAGPVLGRLFNRLFNRKSATPSSSGSRPLSPPRPALPLAMPPPPPPAPGYSPAAFPGQPVGQTAAQVSDPAPSGGPRLPGPTRGTPEPVAEGTQQHDPLDPSSPLAPGTPEALPAAPGQKEAITRDQGVGPGGVRLILEDGTLAEPSLDPELEERLRYLVDNIVPPSDPSPP